MSLSADDVLFFKTPQWQKSFFVAGAAGEAKAEEVIKFHRFYVF